MSSEGSLGRVSSLDVGVVVAGDFEITGLLGKGGMGAVWGARHLRLPGKRVAIKVLLGGMDDAQALARFQREAEIASRIGHAGIVEVLDFNKLPDGTPYQVLEFLAGENLGARLRRGPMPQGAALDVARQIGSALAAAHRAGVVHRDLKPENIFLCPTDAGGVVTERVKVLDFGISKIRGSQTVKTQDQVLIGTPQYMSPEQASGQNAAVDARTDLFALGAIVYEMLSGRPAFSGESVIAVIMNVVTGTPAPLATLVPQAPASVVAAVERALAKKPEERFADVAGFIEALTGKPLQTLGVGPAGITAPGAHAPLSQEELMAATMAPVSGVAATAAPPAQLLTGGAPTGAAPIALTTPPAPAVKRGSPLVWVGAAAVLGAVVVGLAMHRGTPVPAPVPVAAPTEPKAAAPPPPVAPPPVAPPPVAPSPVAPPEPPRTAVAAQPGPSPVSRREKKISGHVLPDDVRADLESAEAALVRGDTREAKRLAQHSLLGQRTGRAFSVLTQAACREGDLTNARAGLRNVGGGERAGVLKACEAAGLDLK
jgi:eukaryotic-like serine/threonine-protein kinase